MGTAANKISKWESSIEKITGRSCLNKRVPLCRAAGPGRPVGERPEPTSQGRAPAQARCRPGLVHVHDQRCHVVRMFYAEGDDGGAGLSHCYLLRAVSSWSWLEGLVPWGLHSGSHGVLWSLEFRHLHIGLTVGRGTWGLGSKRGSDRLGLPGHVTPEGEGLASDSGLRAPGRCASGVSGSFISRVPVGMTPRHVPAPALTPPAGV